MRKRAIAEYPFQILKNWKDPVWWQGVILYKMILPFLFRKNDGSYVVRAPWDNLIILDACRYDVFAEEFERRGMRGKLEYRISRGAETPSFLLENFGDRKFDDVVYVTANPFVDKLLRGKFHKIVSVWRDGWDEKVQTVLAETVCEYALDALGRYPGKRLIVHFMQPHYPYVGCAIMDRSLMTLRDSTLQNTDVGVHKKHMHALLSMYGADIYAMIEREAHFEAYKRNLEAVLPYVEQLMDVLSGRTVVTSDHGEAFGEFVHPLVPVRVYGHLEGFRVPVLVKVPWLVVEQEEEAELRLGQVDEKERLRRKIGEVKRRLSTDPSSSDRMA